jgi:ADP-ribosylglycohydrolase
MTERDASSEADRFAGCLIGQALGDALGFVVEGSGADVCPAYVETALRPRRLSGHDVGAFPLGQYSDDTQLARELATSFVVEAAAARPQYTPGIMRDVRAR